jgi:hypothetical protein
MLKNLLRTGLAATALLFAAASGSSQPAQQQQPYYGGYQQPPPGGYQQGPQGGYQQGPQGGYQQPQNGGYQGSGGGQAGFGGGGGGGELKDGDIVAWKVTLSDASPVAQGYCNYAQKAGCSVQKSEAGVCVAQCPEGMIALMQEGAEVTIGCARISEPQCRALNERILNQ